jgi:hypothetical protein
LKGRLDQAPNAIMKTSVLGFTFGIPEAVLMERSRPVTMADIRNVHSSHDLTSLSPARDRVGQMLKARADLTMLLSCIYLARALVRRSANGGIGVMAGSRLGSSPAFNFVLTWGW